MQPVSSLPDGATTVAARPPLTTPGRVPAAVGNWEPPWTPKMWSGMTFGAWRRLLTRNHFDVDWQRVPMALVITLFTMANSVLAGVQRLVYARRLAQTKICDDPIFVIGHWRSGTTLLHELLAQDPRHTYPTTYECFSPNHFLLTEKIFTDWLGFLLPAKRLQDNVPLAWNRPQEDEFALSNLGAGSPFLRVAFPNRPPFDAEYLDLENISETALERWCNTFQQLLVQITYRAPKRIVLKSPQHSCRIRHLRRLFPEARFVYLVRDPRAVIPSTVQLWKLMFASQGLQIPNYRGLEEQVLATFIRLYESVERARQLVPKSRFCEVRYEDLVSDPVGVVRRVYARLELTHFDQMLPQLEQYVESIAGYQTNRYELSASLAASISDRLQAFLRQHDYP